MPRQLRLRLAGVPFHVIQRGNNRARCFLEEQDYSRYLAYTRDQAHLHRVAVHAYVLMTNHVHLLMTPTAEDGVPQMMKSLGQLYAQYVNRKYERTGSLWEGRYYSCLVDSEAYLLHCHRYIECNPVRAGMVRHPGDYHWSSYRSNAEGVVDPVLTMHPTVRALGDASDERSKAYQELFRQQLQHGLIEEIRTCTRGGYALGTEHFKREVALSLGRRVEKQKPGPKPKAKLREV